MKKILKICRDKIYVFNLSTFKNIDIIEKGDVYKGNMNFFLLYINMSLHSKVYLLSFCDFLSILLILNKNHLLAD